MRFPYFPSIPQKCGQECPANTRFSVHTGMEGKHGKHHFTKKIMVECFFHASNMFRNLQLIVTICQKLSPGKISGRIVPKFERQTFAWDLKKEKSWVLGVFQRRRKNGRDVTLPFRRNLGKITSYTWSILLKKLLSVHRHTDRQHCMS